MATSKHRVQNIEKGALTCKIADSVIEKIVYNETLSIDGIVSFGSTAHKENFNLFARGRKPRGINVEIGEGEVAVKLGICVKYGINIPKLAGMIKQKITVAIQSMTGYDIRAIEVDVTEIQLKGEPKPQKPEPKKK